MTRIEFYKTDHGWQGFKALGHTGFADSGEDIVCAAVSILTQTAVLGIGQVLGIDAQVHVDETKGLLVCLLPQGLNEEQWKQSQLILKVMHVGLTATAEEYGDYVSVKEVPYRENESAIIRL
ncbi:MAG: ribosomal-processing cysteine protease Prp [Firmicutes bacterium]|nr:ribosomal-processing cysteine protease Prp [Bacillota bacterium]